jgi:hypothetical protein
MIVSRVLSGMDSHLHISILLLALEERLPGSLEVDFLPWSRVTTNVFQMSEIGVLRISCLPSSSDVSM